MSRSATPSSRPLLLLALCCASAAGCLPEGPPPGLTAPLDRPPQYPDAEPRGSIEADAAAELDAGFAEDAHENDAEAAPDAEPIPDAGQPADASTGYTWWSDIRPLIEERCGLCHADPPRFGAPSALASYDQLMADTPYAQPMHELVAFRVSAPSGRMPPPSQPQLTEDQIRMIREWSMAGAPEGTPPPDAGVLPGADAGASPDASVRDAALPWANGASSPDAGPGQRWIDTFAHAPGSRAPFEIPMGGTSYVCWGFEVPTTTAAVEHAVLFQPIHDNTRHIHHIFVFHDPDGTFPDGPAPCPNLGTERVMTGWFPGRGDDATPPGVGYRVQPGERLVLQVHYDSVTAPATFDQTGTRVLLTTQPGLISAGEFWSGAIWNSPVNGNNVSRSGTCTLTQAVTIYRAVPHMHTYGRRLLFEVDRGGNNQWTTLIDVNPWNFDDQPTYDIPMEQQQFLPGDRLRTTCWWNTQGQSVSFGLGSEEEMCFTMMNHYPFVYDQLDCVQQLP